MNQSRSSAAIHSRRLKLEHLENRDVMAAGDLDVAFGTNGLLRIESSSQYPSSDFAAGSLYVFDQALGLPTARRFSVQGAADTGFGVDGEMFLEYTAAASQNPGKVITFRQNIAENQNFNGILSRYDSAGDLDTSFGTNGETELDFTPDLTYGTERIGRDFPIAVKVASDDKVWALMAGDLNAIIPPDFLSQHHLGVARLTAAGALDTSFSTNGLFAHEIDPPGRINPTDLLLTEDGGAIIVGWQSADFTEPIEMFAIRLTAAGELDTNFGTAGKVVFNSLGTISEFANYRAAYDAATGKTVLGYYAETANPNEYELRLTRFTATGAIDTSFGTNGVVSTGHLENLSSFSLLDEFDIATQTDGKTVVTFGNPEWILHRYTPQGVLDNSFGTNGIVTTDISGNSGDVATPTDLDIQFDGKIVVTGRFAPQGGVAEVAVARYQARDIGTTDAQSKVNTLPTFTFENQFTVTWGGTATGGIADYDIYYNINGGTPFLWKAGTTATSAVFDIASARRSAIGFFSVARDNSGNEEAAPQFFDATTFFAGVPWQNPNDRYDVVVNDNDPPDQRINIADILSVIFEFNQRRISSALSDVVILPPVVDYLNGPYPDVNGDNKIDIADILAVIFRFNQVNSSGEGEGESAVDAEDASLVSAAIPAPATSSAPVATPTNEISASTPSASSNSSASESQLVYLIGYELANKKSR